MAAFIEFRANREFLSLWKTRSRLRTSRTCVLSLHSHRQNFDDGPPENASDLPPQNWGRSCTPHGILGLNRTADGVVGLSVLFFGLRLSVSGSAACPRTPLASLWGSCSGSAPIPPPPFHLAHSTSSVWGFMLYKVSFTCLFCHCVLLSPELHNFTAGF